MLHRIIGYFSHKILVQVSLAAHDQTPGIVKALINVKSDFCPKYCLFQSQCQVLDMSFCEMNIICIQSKVLHFVYF